MATVNYTVEDVSLGSQFGSKARIVTWTGITEADVGQAYVGCGFSDKSVMITGTWGGESVRMEGTNDTTPGTWITLTDALLNTILYTSDNGAQILENYYQVRPNVAGAGTGTDIDVKLLLIYHARM